MNIRQILVSLSMFAAAFAIIEHVNGQHFDIFLSADVPPSIPPENVQRLIKSLASREYKGRERRRHLRYSVVVPVIALPLSSDFRIDGEPVQMTTANLSLGGAALVHTRFVDAPYLALDFTIAGMDLLQVVLKVLRVRNMGPVYDIGGEFISRVSQEPK